MATSIKILMTFCMGVIFGIIISGVALFEGKKQSVGIEFDMPEEIGLVQEKDFLVVERVVENDSLKVITLGFFGKN